MDLGILVRVQTSQPDFAKQSLVPVAPWNNATNRSIVGAEGATLVRLCHYDTLRKGERSYEEVDIVIDSPVDYKDVVKNALKVKIKGLNLTVISPEDFIKMKKASGRDNDLEDIKNLKLARRAK